MKVPSTEVQNNFGRFLNLACEGQDVIVTKNGKEVAKIVEYTDNKTIRESVSPYGKENWVTYKEFIDLTEYSKSRYELIDGEVFNLSSPNYFHQYTVTELIVTFYNWFKGKECRPLTAPFDITLTKTLNNINVVQPDIIVICDTDNLDDKGNYKGIPRLLVEVLSPLTHRHDMLKKLDLYMQTGVEEYWIANPIKREVYVYTFKDKDIIDYKVYVDDAIVASDIFDGLEIKLENIFIPQ